MVRTECGVFDVYGDSVSEARIEPLGLACLAATILLVPARVVQFSARSGFGAAPPDCDACGCSVDAEPKLHRWLFAGVRTLQVPYCSHFTCIVGFAETKRPPARVCPCVRDIVADFSRHFWMVIPDGISALFEESE